jgi:hypothetical protein
MATSFAISMTTKYAYFAGSSTWGGNAFRVRSAPSANTANPQIWYTSSQIPTAWNRQIRKIDLKEIGFTKSKVRKIPVDEEQAQNIKDVTQGLR